MSADNCVAILKTSDTMISIDDYSKKNMGKPVSVWRVKHIQAHRDFYEYLEKEIHNLGAWMLSVFEDAEVFYSENDAYDYADTIYFSDIYIEHGIEKLDASKYNFPFH